MQVIHAGSLTHHVKIWLTASEHARVLHVFEDACNLINENGEVLSVVTQKIGDGPFNLVVEEDILFSDHLNAESKVSIQPNRLTFENLDIKIDQAELWSSHPNWGILYAKRNNILNQVTSLPKWESFIKQEIAHRHCIRSAVHVSSQSALLAMTPYTDFLISSIVSADISKSIDSVKQLAGLGQGLTPSGDDFILGAILAAWIIHPHYVARVLAEEITNAAAPLTTSLSAAWLRSAGRGEAGILWHNFFNALIVNDSNAIQLYITELLFVGHTSGADAFAGFISTLICYEEKSCPS
jgi:hypothetical protein